MKKSLIFTFYLLFSVLLIVQVTQAQSRPIGYGMTAESKKTADQFNQELATQVLQWMRVVLDEGGLHETANSLPITITKYSDFHELLKDGTVLCKLINVIKPGSVKKINESKMAFKMMGNIGNFLDAANKVLGINKYDLFQTVDLYEAQNLPQVIKGVFAFARKAQTIVGYNGPVLGGRKATNMREFSEEQLRFGEGIFGLQAGENRGESSNTFGKIRSGNY
ncbi:hypothetical protein PN36_15290 [Candidatus Thiomargarita nelsonii]|uniref:Calponin-homology (CH) domain-containing protein n=1 Tax=Candidatus Thiomargarita nelsonii TaxID=1003181 RepID=A0A0A6P390_9GAMM|nr:hypothetical protein PN36_15290 [Candidatus Thiomargarita nelsonii]